MVESKCELRELKRTYPARICGNLWDELNKTGYFNLRPFRHRTGLGGCPWGRFDSLQVQAKHNQDPRLNNHHWLSFGRWCHSQATKQSQIWGGYTEEPLLSSRSISSEPAQGLWPNLASLWEKREMWLWGPYLKEARHLRWPENPLFWRFSFQVKTAYSYSDVLQTVSDLNQADSWEHRSTSTRFSSFCHGGDYHTYCKLGSYVTSGLHHLFAKWGLLLLIWRWGKWHSEK